MDRLTIWKLIAPRSSVVVCPARACCSTRAERGSIAALSAIPSRRTLSVSSGEPSLATGSRISPVRRSSCLGSQPRDWPCRLLRRAAASRLEPLANGQVVGATRLRGRHHRRRGLRRGGVDSRGPTAAEHVFAERVAFRSFLVASVLLGLVTAGSKVFTFRASAAWWSFGALLLAFILIGIFGPSRRTEAGLVVQVVAQKAIVFSALVIVAFQSYEAQRAARRLEQVEGPSQPYTPGHWKPRHPSKSSWG